MSIDQHHQEMMSLFHYIRETQIPDLNKERTGTYLKIEIRNIDKSKRDEIYTVYSSTRDFWVLYSNRPNRSPRTFRISRVFVYNICLEEKGSTKTSRKDFNTFLDLARFSSVFLSIFFVCNRFEAIFSVRDSIVR